MGKSRAYQISILPTFPRHDGISCDPLWRAPDLYLRPWPVFLSQMSCNNGHLSWVCAGYSHRHITQKSMGSLRGPTKKYWIDWDGWLEEMQRSALGIFVLPSLLSIFDLSNLFSARRSRPSLGMNYGTRTNEWSKYRACKPYFKICTDRTNLTRCKGFSSWVCGRMELIRPAGLGVFSVSLEEPDLSGSELVTNLAYTDVLPRSCEGSSCLRGKCIGGGDRYIRR